MILKSNEAVLIAKLNAVLAICKVAREYVDPNNNDFVIEPT